MARCGTGHGNALTARDRYAERPGPLFCAIYHAHDHSPSRGTCDSHGSVPHYPHGSSDGYYPTPSIRWRHTTALANSDSDPRDDHRNIRVDRASNTNSSSVCSRAPQPYPHRRSPVALP